MEQLEFDFGEKKIFCCMEGKLFYPMKNQYLVTRYFSDGSITEHWDYSGVISGPHLIVTNYEVGGK